MRSHQPDPQPTLGPAWRNADVDWGLFDADWYRDHNYRSVRDDDRQLMTLIRDFFADCGVVEGNGIDVGAGPNLYPALAMLPFCRRIDLLDVSARNIEWLRRAVPDYDTGWDAFWAVYREHRAYAAVTDPRQRMARTCAVRQQSLFDLPPGGWDLGTMFFVACSISTDRSEFQASLDTFIRALKPRAPFALAVMERSVGYDVHGAHFPAVSVRADDLRQALAGRSDELAIHRVVDKIPLRAGYGGAMLLATGHAAGSA